MPKCKLCGKGLDMKKEETYINVKGSKFAPMCIDCYVHGVDHEYPPPEWDMNDKERWWKYD